MISTSTKIVEKVEKEIITQKEKVTELRAKEKEITTKITTSSETTDIETLKKELNQVTSQITSVKDIIKTTTQKKVEETTKITDSTTLVSEMTSKIETAELEAVNAEE